MGGDMQREQTMSDVQHALERYERPLLRFAATIVGKETAADVVQDVFLELVKEPWEKVVTLLRESLGSAAIAFLMAATARSHFSCSVWLGPCDQRLNTGSQSLIEIDLYDILLP